MAEVLFATNTASASPTIPNTDTAISSGNIKANMYKWTKVTAKIQVTTSGTSATNTISYKLKLGSTTLATASFKTDAVARIIPFHVEYLGDLSAGGAVSVTHSASAADANTTSQVTALYVEGIE